KVTNLYDGLSNVLSNLGTRRDKAALSHYEAQNLTPQELLNAYRYAWLPRKIVELPALDALREWREWKTEDAPKIEAVEQALGLQRKTLEALKSARLYGYAGIYIGTNRKDVSRPLSDNEEIRHLTVLNCDNLAPEENITDPTDPNYGQPSMYIVGTARVHPSRIAIFSGADVPGQVLGDSVLNAPYQAVRDADGTASNVSSMTYEAKLDVFGIPNLSERLSEPGGEEAIMQRLQAVNMGKSVSNAITLDNGGGGTVGETFQQKQLSFAGVNDILLPMYQVAAGASNIPVTRRLGKSASGLNATGDNEIREYYDTISARQSLELTPALANLDRLVVKAAGIDPDSVDYEWRSLWQLDEKERAEVGQKNADTLDKLVKSTLFPD